MNSFPKRVNVLGCPVDRVTIPDILKWIENTIRDCSPRMIAVVNANKLHLMRGSPELRSVILQADLVIPEWAVVWGAKRLGLPALYHSGGLLVAVNFMPYAAKTGLRPYFLGAKAPVVELAARKLRDQHPGLSIAGYHDGYLSDEASEREVLAEIRDRQPDVLFVGMGSPKQELWIWKHHKTLGVPVSIGVGGSFDVLSGLKRDTPTWARGKGIEWLYRTAQDPKAYLRRYLVTNTWFVWQVLRAKVAQKSTF